MTQDAPAYATVAATKQVAQPKHTGKKNMDKKRTAATSAPLPPQQHAATSASVPGEEVWKTVSYNKQRRGRSRASATIRATGDADTILLTAERRKYLHIWNFQKDVTEGNIFTYLKRKLAPTVSTDLIISKPINKHEEHNCFILSIPEEHFKTLISPSLWPQRISMQQWHVGNKNTKHTPRPFRVQTEQTVKSTAVLPECSRVEVQAVHH